MFTLLVYHYCVIENDTPHDWAVPVWKWKPKKYFGPSITCGLVSGIIDDGDMDRFTEMDAFNLVYQPIMDYIKETINNNEITIDKLRKYHSVGIITRYSKLPSLKEHWSQNWKTYGITGTPFVQKVLTRDQWYNLHNLYHKNYDLHKVVEILNEQFQKLWIPHQHITLDDGYPASKCRSAYVLRKSRKTHLFGKWFVKITISLFKMDIILN